MEEKQVRCPRCDSTDVEPTKEWDLKGGKGGQDFHATQYKCRKCEKSFRILERI